MFLDPNNNNNKKNEIEQLSRAGFEPTRVLNTEVLKTSTLTTRSTELMITNSFNVIVNILCTEIN